MKIIWKDGYNREQIADRLVAENIQNEEEGRCMVAGLRDRDSKDHGQWYELVADDYRLWRGMEDLV